MPWTAAALAWPCDQAAYGGLSFLCPHSRHCAASQHLGDCVAKVPIAHLSNLVPAGDAWYKSILSDEAGQRPDGLYDTLPDTQNAEELARVVEIQSVAGFCDEVVGRLT